MKNIVTYKIYLKYVVMFSALGIFVLAYWFVNRKDKFVTESGSWKPNESQLAKVTPLDQRVYKEIVIGEKKMKVELVGTPIKIITGLSYREEIGSDGMLFDLGDRHVPSFWMLGMLFPIDIVWIDCGEYVKTQNSNVNAECKVVDITKNALVEADPNHPKNFYSPRMPVTHVLEVNSKQYGSIDISDLVLIK